MQPSDSERIKTIREDLDGISQAKFANLLDIPAHKIKDIESGKIKISVEVALLIEEKLRYNFRWLLTGEGDPVLRDISRSNDMDDDPVTSELLKAARTVLKSGNPVAIDALERNIRYFAHAIESERRYNAIEKRLSALEERERKKAERIREGDPPEEKEEIIKKRAI